MSRAVTAIYRTHATASLVRDELGQLGIANHNITVLPDREIVPDTSNPTRSTATRTDADGDMDRLNRLDLPEADVRTYQQAIRNGDYVVSVEVDDQSKLARIQEIMQRPEQNHVTGGTDSGRGHVVHDGTRTVAAVYDTQAEAGEAVNRLQRAGIHERCIRVAPTPSEKQKLANDDGRHKRFWESLGDFSFPDEDRYTYAEALARGSFLVVVHDFDSSMHDRIVDILDEGGTVDLDARESEWRSSGWSGYGGSDYSRDRTAPAAAGVATATTSRDTNTRSTSRNDGRQDRNVQMAADAGRRSQADLGSQQQGFAGAESMRQNQGGWGSAGAGDGERNEDGTVKVVDERLDVGKREVEGGSVRVRSYVREEPVDADVDLRSTRVFVERRPVDRAAAPGDMTAGDRTLEVRETHEEPVINKEARVTEEIELGRETEVEHRHVHDTVRHTEVDIEDDRTGERTTLTDKDRNRS